MLPKGESQGTLRSQLLPYRLAFAVALNVYSMVDLFNVFPFVELIGIAELDIIRNIKSNRIRGAIGRSIRFGFAEFYIG